MVASVGQLGSQYFKYQISIPTEQLCRAWHIQMQELYQKLYGKDWRKRYEPAVIYTDVQARKLKFDKKVVMRELIGLVRTGQ